MNESDLRFDGIARLYGAAGLAQLRAAHVCVVGIGGVGSWVVEALARSGIGALTLVDLDDVCSSNVNRQIHAIDDTIGLPKVEVMAQRAGKINPACAVTPIQDFLTAANADSILAAPFDYVCDAIDNVTNKCVLISACKQRRLRVITSGSAGGRRVPGHIRVADLGLSSHDPLLQQVRKKLRQSHGFPAAAQALFDVKCVFSSEPAIYPREDGSVCDTREPGADLRLGCEGGYGTATFVTGAFGFAAAAEIVADLGAARQ